MKKINKLLGLLVAIFTCVTTVNALVYDANMETEEDDGYYSLATIQDYEYDKSLLTLEVSNEEALTMYRDTNNYKYEYATKINNVNFKSNGEIHYIKFFKSSDKFTISKPIITVAGNNTIDKLHTASKIKVEGNGSLKINKAIESVLKKDKDGKQLYIPQANLSICIDDECDTDLTPIINFKSDIFNEEVMNNFLNLTEEELEEYITELYVTEDYDINSLKESAKNTEEVLNYLFKTIFDMFGGATANINFSVKYDEITKENIKLTEAYEAKEVSITKEWADNYIETTLPVVVNSDGSVVIGTSKEIAITDFTIGNDYMNFDNVDLDINESTEIITNITPNDASEILTWKSSDEKIATVNSRGIIKGISNGNCTVTVENKAGKKYTINVTVFIPMDLAKVSNISDQTYTGKEIKPAVVVTYKDKKLVEGKDYELSYENNIKVGKAYVYAEGLGDYSGYAFTTFNIISNTIFSAKQSARTNNSVTLKWNKPASKTTGYQVYMASSATGKYTKVATTSKTSYKQTKLKAGSKYYFKIRSYYKSGKKVTYGDFIEVIATTAPATPSIKLASNTSAVKVSYAKVSGATGYEIYESSDKKTYTKVATTTNTSQLVENLSSAKTYYYKVRAYKTIDEVNVYGSYSKVVSITTKPLTPVVSNTALSYKYATITWDKVSGVNGYEVYRSTNGKKYTKVKTLKTNSYKDTKVNVGTTYYYKVRAYKTVNKKKVYSAYSTVVTAKPYLKATTVTGTTDYYDYARINFTKVSGANGYKIYRADSADGKYANIGKTTNLYYNDKTAKANTEYYYKVVAYRNVNKKAKNGLASTAASAKRLGYTIDFNVLANTYNSNKIAITKDATALKYYIYRATSKNGKYTLVSTLKASDFKENIEYIDTKLTFNKTYYYKVRISNKNASGYSAAKSVKTKLATPNVEGKVEDNKIVVTYNKVGNATGYEIYRSTDGENYKKVKTTTATYYNDTNVELGNTYYYKVRAYKTVNKTKYYSSLSKELKVNIEDNRIKLDKPSLVVHTIKEACGKDCVGIDPTLNYAYVDGTFVYDINTDVKPVDDKYPVDGWELYTVKDNEYTLVKEYPIEEVASIEKKLNEIDTYAVRTYKLNENNEKVYSEYSDSVVIGPMLGDLNADLKVNEEDTTKLLEYINNPIDTYAKELADVNNDGVVNLTDYYLLDNYVKGNIDTLNYDGLLTPNLEIDVIPNEAGGLALNGATRVKFNITNINGTYIEYYTVLDDEVELKGEQSITDYYKNGNIDITVPVIASKFGFKVRTYKIVNEEKVYSEYSTVKYFD